MFDIKSCWRLQLPLVAEGTSHAVRLASISIEPVPGRVVLFTSGSAIFACMLQSESNAVTRRFLNSIICIQTDIYFLRASIQILLFLVLYFSSRPGWENIHQIDKIRAGSRYSISFFFTTQDQEQNAAAAAANVPSLEKRAQWFLRYCVLPKTKPEFELCRIKWASWLAS